MGISNITSTIACWINQSSLEISLCSLLHEQLSLDIWIHSEFNLYFTLQFRYVVFFIAMHFTCMYSWEIWLIIWMPARFVSVRQLYVKLVGQPVPCQQSPGSETGTKLLDIWEARSAGPSRCLFVTASKVSSIPLQLYREHQASERIIFRNLRQVHAT